jgi:cellulose synthase/poly-beta-1,6-N-acetylglucosamine synthase-like glycosyltransferase
VNSRAAAAVFWVLLFAMIYTYVLYPVLLFLLASLRQTGRDLNFLLGRRVRRSADRESFTPSVAMLVAAHNEAAVIEAKLRNTTVLDYPAGQFQLLLGLDASTDTTRDLAGRVSHPSFSIFPFTERRGKLAVLADLAQRTTAEILVFSDANTLLDPAALRKLARHFSDPGVGAVCGELRLMSADGKPAMEAQYWRYEVVLKFLENRLNCVLGANGAVFAVRRELYRPPASAIVEDFQIPMDIRFSGRRVVYDLEAVGMEEVAPTSGDEFRRKVRIGTGVYQTLLACPRFLNPLRGMPAFAYFSHKVLRWLVPYFLLILLVTNVLLVRKPLYTALLAVQALFYALAFVGGFRLRRGKAAGAAGVAFYFLSMNLALFLGSLRLLGGNQSTVWASTPRRAPAESNPCENAPATGRPTDLARRA